MTVETHDVVGTFKQQKIENLFYFIFQAVRAVWGSSISDEGNT